MSSVFSLLIIFPILLSPPPSLPPLSRLPLCLAQVRAFVSSDYLPERSGRAAGGGDGRGLGGYRRRSLLRKGALRLYLSVLFHVASFVCLFVIITFYFSA